MVLLLLTTGDTHQPYHGISNTALAITRHTHPSYHVFDGAVPVAYWSQPFIDSCLLWNCTS